MSLKLGKLEPLNLLLYIIPLLAYLSLRIITMFAIQEVRTTPDTVIYTHLASQPLWSSAFWSGSRPFTVPLVYNLLDNNFQLIVIFQSALSMFSWSLLAVSVARLVQLHWFKPIAFAIVLIFGMSSEIIMWDWVILSESISLSLLALFIASWLWLIEEWQWHKVWVVMLVGVLWVFTRDPNAWAVLILAGLLALVAIVWRTHRRYFILAIIFIAFFTASNASSNLGERWVFPFENVLAKRILPVPERTAYFAEHGMPITPALMERSGKWASSDEWAFDNDPDLEEFREWLHKSGKFTYIRFLLSNPSYTFLEPLRHGQDPYSEEEGSPAAGFSEQNNPTASLAGRLAYDDVTNGFRPILPEQPLREFLWTLGVGTIVSHLAILIVAMLAWPTQINSGRSLPTITNRNLYYAASAFPQWLYSVGWRQHKQLLVPLGVALTVIWLAFPLAAVIWHGDAMEIARHSVPVLVQLRLGLLMLILFEVDIILTHRLMKG
jgi:hypothetical protein